MATHSSILAWRIPWAKRPGELQSMGPQGVGHDRVSMTTTILRIFNSYYLSHNFILGSTS